MDSTTDMTEVEVEAQFKAFDAILKSNIAGVGMAQRLCDQSQLKKENDKLQVRNVSPICKYSEVPPQL